MSDRLSQLQDKVNILAGYFCDATGVLQAEAKPNKFENFAESLDRGYDAEDGNSEEKLNEIKLTFAQLITATAKQIDTLIDSLPNEEESNEKFLSQQLTDLEVENAIAARQLEYTTKCAENLLEQIQKKISQIAESQLSVDQNTEENEEKSI